MAIVRKTLQQITDAGLHMTEEQARRLANLSDEDIDYSDIPELDEEFFKHAKRVTLPRKKSVNLRLDSDILTFFKKQGKGYQTRINRVLRLYVEAQGKSLLR
jgi:uncharacterized protein (DUF4415 family)